MKYISYLIVMFVIGVFMFLTFYRLGINALWHDEAEVALVAKQVLQSGLPSVGTNAGLLPIGHTNNFHLPSPPYLIRLQTWAMFYIAASGISVFGPTLFGARVPFAVLGILIIPLFYLLIRKIIQNNHVALVATALLMFSTQFILLIRETRYYVPVMLFSLLAVYAFIRGYLDDTSHKVPVRWCFQILHFLSLTALFHTHYLSFFAIFPGFVVTYLCLRFGIGIQKSNKMYDVAFVISSIALVIPSLLWMFRVVGSGNSVTMLTSMSMSGWLSACIELIKKLNRHVPMVCVFAGWWLLRVQNSASKEVNRESIFLIKSICISVLLVVSFLTFLQVPPSIFSEFRYILPIFPLSFIFVAIVFYHIPKRFRIIQWILFLVIVGTNILSLPIELVTRESYWPLAQKRLSVRSYLSEYIYFELYKGYIGPVDGLIDFLRDRIQPRDHMLISSEGISLLYQFPYVVVDNDYTFFHREKRSIQPQDLLGYRWIVFRSTCPIECMFPDPTEYKAIISQYYTKRMIYIEDYIVQNREEIPYHLFQTSIREPYIELYEYNHEK